MASRAARCACGRVTLVVETEPAVVSVCHCDFCQKRTGSVFQVGAYFGPDEPFAITGETRAYNGLEQDGAASVSGTSVTYHFCPTCGSTVYWEVEGLYRGLPVGNFVDPELPPPTQELHTADRHGWVTPVPGADQLPGAFE